ncbi:pyridoxamine 5'-phosphate oxidase family protein [Crenobacter sp. SG2305]|uniref:pyridoxamine 5'-phosphate oxidase family protein n=1 Tax=Crenobacter oryzisoli TaxID=3056844 RepID=UPI0025AB1C03|nr:pyridoxamine 5'-phosphate oxidase family protein [Crenobacter sp. SG2305]MDN0081960.1 pyridoxamine 5'-phosphate oxidase family protein [Crenobacter sp. SG2305]
MDTQLKTFILEIMATSRDMSLATLREDGYPQANLVSYANDDFLIYFATARDSSKVRNIAFCEKVSLTINTPYNDWPELRALSMAATAQILPDDSAECAHAVRLLARKFSSVWDMVPQDQTGQTLVIRVQPWLISALDYRQGFGHATLVSVPGFKPVTGS